MAAESAEIAFIFARPFGKIRATSGARRTVTPSDVFTDKLKSELQSAIPDIAVSPGASCHEWADYFAAQCNRVLGVALLKPFWRSSSVQYFQG